jgi:hypothetical protein
MFEVNYEKIVSWPSRQSFIPQQNYTIDQATGTFHLEQSSMLLQLSEWLYARKGGILD